MSPEWWSTQQIHEASSLPFLSSLQDEYPLASLPLLGYSVTVPAESENIHKDYVFKLHFKSHVYYFRSESEYTFERWGSTSISATSFKQIWFNSEEQNVGNNLVVCRTPGGWKWSAAPPAPPVGPSPATEKIFIDESYFFSSPFFTLSSSSSSSLWRSPQWRSGFLAAQIAKKTCRKVLHAALSHTD